MEYLIFAGLVSFLFGLLFLISPEVLMKMGAVSNRTIMVLDEKISPVKSIVGIVLILAGVFMVWSVYPYNDLWYVTIIAVISLFFGFLFVFFPNGLKFLSDACNMILISPEDELIMGARKTIGILLVILSIYLFYVYYSSAFIK